MANPLQSSLSTASPMPPAPNPQPQEPSQPNALAAPQQAIGMPGPQQGQPPPAPNHAQTVAALRHFHAINSELEALASDPDLGKADMKSKVIDGATKLVGMRIMSPSQAVMQLGEFPSAPYQQKQWVMKHLQANQKAADSVLDHHRVAHAGIQDMPAGNPDDHTQDMNAMMQSHYAGRGNA